MAPLYRAYWGVVSWNPRCVTKRVGLPLTNSQEWMCSIPEDQATLARLKLPDRCLNELFTDLKITRSRLAALKPT